MKKLVKLEKTHMHVEIETELLEKVKIEIKKRGLKLRQVVEFYFKEFLNEK